MRRMVIAVGVALALLATACGTGDSAGAGGGEVRTVLVDYQHDEFASAFLRYYPEKVTVRPGDTVRFKQQWTGEPHSVTMGQVVDDMFGYQELLMKYESEEEALADGVTQETVDDVLATFSRIPGMIGENEEVYQPGAQPCYVDDKDDVPMFTTPDEEINPDAECPPGAKEQPPFNGQALYNSGFIPYAGESGNTFEVPIADDLEPGTYMYFCNFHWIGMSGQIEVVDPGSDIPSQSTVTSQARREILEDAKVALERVREARKTKGGSKIGDLEAPLAGREADEDFAVIINEFLPKNASAKVGEPVTWTFDGSAHTVSFKVPKYFPLFEVRKDGTVYRNPEAYEPVGVEVPEREGDPFSDEGSPVEVDGGRWDGRGGFKSSGSLFPGDKFTITFTRPGTYPYACVLHPQMVGTVEVRE
jgi:plastocyanin